MLMEKTSSIELVGVSSTNVIIKNICWSRKTFLSWLYPKLYRRVNQNTVIKQAHIGLFGRSCSNQKPFNNRAAYYQFRILQCTINNFLPLRIYV